AVNTNTMVQFQASATYHVFLNRGRPLISGNNSYKAAKPRYNASLIIVWPKKYVIFLTSRGSFLKLPPEKYSAKNRTTRMTAEIKQARIPISVTIEIIINGGVSEAGFFFRCCQPNACLTE